MFMGVLVVNNSLAAMECAETAEAARAQIIGLAAKAIEDEKIRPDANIHYGQFKFPTIDINAEVARMVKFYESVATVETNGKLVSDPHKNRDAVAIAIGDEPDEPPCQVIIVGEFPSEGNPN